MESGNGPAGPPTSKTEYVLQRLRQDILAGTVIPGESLRQADLAARYGVSPTPVREALRLLEADGTVSYRPHKGATVAELTPSGIEDLYLLRAAMEGLATRLTVERMTQDDEAEILRLHEQISSSVGTASGEELGSLNRKLHFAIYEVGSPLIAGQLTAQWRLFPPRVTMWQEELTARKFVKQHQSIIEALLDRDAGLAGELMENHIHTACKERLRLETSLDSDPAASQTPV